MALPVSTDMQHFELLIKITLLLQIQAGGTLSGEISNNKVSCDSHEDAIEKDQVHSKFVTYTCAHLSFLLDTVLENTV